MEGNEVEVNYYEEVDDNEFELEIYKDLDQRERENGSNESDVDICINHLFVLFVNYTVSTWFSHI